MNNQLVKELQINNLLIALNMSADTPKNNEIRENVLKYIVNQEMTALQFDIVLLPKKDDINKDYNFHLR